MASDITFGNGYRWISGIGKLLFDQNRIRGNGSVGKQAGNSMGLGKQLRAIQAQGDIC
jgi:hypothetical protein